MQRRLLAILLAFSAVVIAVCAGPLLTSTADVRTRQWELERTGELGYIVSLAQRNPTQVSEHVITYFRTYHEPVMVVDAQRNVVVSIGAISPGDGEVRRAVDRVLRDEPIDSIPRIDPWSRRPVLLAQPITSQAVTTGAVLLRASPSRTAGEIGMMWIAIAIGIAAAGVALVFLARGLARWIVRPLARLAGGMRAVAAGQRGARLSLADGPQELRELVTVFNRMSQAVEHAAEQQHRLVADASHQMRNPVATLRLCVDDLELAGSPADADSHQILASEVERLENLLEGLLRMARADGDAEALVEQGSCDARIVLADRVDAWKPFADRRRVELHLSDTSPGPGAVDCPETDLAQILDVILDNAIRYGGPRISARTVRSLDRVCLEVSDNGPGLTDEQRRLALRRFWRGPSSDTSGTGLGLPIAVKLVERRGGVLNLGSASPSGLRVSVELATAADLPS